MELVVNPNGQIVGLYGEAIDLKVLGTVSIRRAGHVEPDADGHWWVDLSPLSGPRLGPFGFRSEALTAEEAWVTSWLGRGLGHSASEHHFSAPHGKEDAE